MNHNHIEDALQFLGHSGNILSRELTVVLYHSLTCLQNDNHFHQVYFWGLILGIEKDYYVAYGYVKDALRGRIFFYSMDGIHWWILPKPIPDVYVLSLTCTSMFQGDSAYLIDLADQPKTTKNQQLDTPQKTESTEDDVLQESVNPADIFGAGEAGVVIDSKEGEIKEEDRLAAVVDMINEETAIVPRGALLRRHDDIIVENLPYSGLSFPDSEILMNYFHFRSPLQKWNTNLLSNPAKNYNYSIDFLDTIDRDISLGKCWSRQYAMGRSTVLMQNLYWPGSIFYHRLNSSEYGNLYVGSGRREIDFPFML